MLKDKKVLKQIQQEKEELELIKQELEEEKKQLLFIKEQLEDSSAKIDITNVFVLEKKGIYSLVKLNIKEIEETFLGTPVKTNGYESTLIDIFSNEIVFQKYSKLHIQNKELIFGSQAIQIDGIQREQYWINIYPISEFYHDVLIYADKQVPLYALQQIYYDINNVDFDSKLLKRK